MKEELYKITNILIKYHYLLGEYMKKETSQYLYNYEVAQHNVDS